MNVMVTNIPATYRIDLYEKLGRAGWRMLFYARHSQTLRYCSEDKLLKFPFEDVTIISIFMRLLFLRPKVLLCINASPFSLLCGIYALIFRKRFVIWWAGTIQSEAHVGHMKRLFRRFVFRLADAFIVYSEHAGSYLASMGIDEQKISMLGNLTFDPAKFRSLNSNSARKSHPPTLLSVGNLIKRKNHLFLLNVFSILQNKIPELRLVIAGEGPERAALEKLIEEMRLEGVQLKGHVPNNQIPVLLSQADVLVHPATMDQWPQVLNEAMAAGVPIVVSPQSGVSNYFFEVGRELLMPELNINVFATAITTLLEDDILRSKMATAAEQKAATLYSSVQQTIDRVCRTTT